MALPVLDSGRPSAPAPGGGSWPWASRAAHCDPLLARAEKTSGSTAFLPAGCGEGCGRGRAVTARTDPGPALQPSGTSRHAPAGRGVALEPERGREAARPLPPAACAGAEGSSGAAPPPPGSPAGMLRLGRGLRRLLSARGARASAGLPLGAEMPKKAGATNKASASPVAGGGGEARGREAGRGGCCGLPPPSGR